MGLGTPGYRAGRWAGWGRGGAMAAVFKVWTTDPKSGTKRKSAKYYCQLKDESGKIKRKALSENRAVAQAMLRALLNTAERAKVGIHDPHAQHRMTPLADHLTAFRAALEAKACSPAHVGIQNAKVARVIEACQWGVLDDLDAEALTRWLAERRKLPRTQGGFGVQSSNHFVAALKAFGNWLVRAKRIAANPFAHVSKLNAAPDVRHARREFKPDELAGLVAAAKAGPPMRDLTGEARAKLYTVASMSGLRASELASLTAASFRLDADPPTVQVAAAYSKRRRTDSVPLHPQLVAELRVWLAKFKPGVPLWPGSWASQFYAGRMLHRDLAAARAAWVAGGRTKGVRAEREASDAYLPRDREGKCLDFHALRHSFISALVAAGVTPAVAMQLARHSTITLTMDRYAHVNQSESVAGIGKLTLPGAKP